MFAQFLLIYFLICLSVILVLYSRYNTRITFLWFDAWIGFYYDRTLKILYFCPLPMLVFIFSKEIDETYYLSDIEKKIYWFIKRKKLVTLVDVQDQFLNYSEEECLDLLMELERACLIYEFEINKWRIY